MDSTATPIVAAGTADFFKRRRDKTLVLGFFLVAISLASSLATGFSAADAFRAVPKAFAWLAANMVPNAESLAYLPRIAVKLTETILISIAATVCAAALAFVSALLASRTTQPHPAIAAAVRLVATVLRNIPVAAWAMIFLFSFGQSGFTGFLAILLETYGFLARSFAETVDETAESSVEALRASGASWSQTVAQSVVPSVLPQIVSWMLYMVETNIRSATLVGILTGTGIGFAFSLYYKSMNYPAAGLVTVAVIAAVLAIEAISNAVRRIIL